MNFTRDSGRVELTPNVGPPARILVKDGDREYWANLKWTPDVEFLVGLAFDYGLDRLWIDDHPDDARLRIQNQPGTKFEKGVQYICFADERSSTDTSGGTGWVFVIDYQSSHQVQTSFQSRYAEVLVNAGLASRSKSRNGNAIVSSGSVASALELLGFTLSRLRSTSDELLRTPTSDPVELEDRVGELRRRGRLTSAPLGQKSPRKKRSAQRTFARERCPDVAVWALQRAADAGHLCEQCHELAPFRRSSGDPFLEVHHIMPLSEDGPDTPANTAALCPNCHREAHCGESRNVLRKQLAEWRKAHP